eukprot:m.134715 g.134715  ORF g.134715 m.134715 type:complete len:168 (+) comp52446_c0_seq4:1185-1688(+)
MAAKKGAKEDIFHFKVVLLGASSAGKTCICSRFVNDNFLEAQTATVGALFSTKNIFLDNEEVKLEIWDTAGQERFSALTPMYYRGAQAAVVVYDITKRDSFDRVKTWVKELETNAGGDIVIAIVGNKADLGSKGDGQRVISAEVLLESVHSVSVFVSVSVETLCGNQ